jgi:hypothetical protein
MDRNGDGSVDKKELFSWILRSFRSLSQEESTDRFQDTDDDQVYFCSRVKYHPSHDVKIFLLHFNLTFYLYNHTLLLDVCTNPKEVAFSIFIFTVSKTFLKYAV